MTGTDRTLTSIFKVDLGEGIKSLINVTWGQGLVDVDSDHIRFSAWLNSFEAVKDTLSGFKDTLAN